MPRGLVSLQLIVGLALAAVPLAVALTAARDAWLTLPLALVWLWMALMAVEFFVPDWLKARPFLYLVSHMLIMPLIDLFITACEWLTRAGSPPAAPLAVPAAELPERLRARDRAQDLRAAERAARGRDLFGPARRAGPRRCCGA